MLRAERGWWVVPLAVFAALEIVAAAFGPYGYFIDELYYIACSKRLAWGYVDHPPLCVALLTAVRAVLGSSMLAIRLPAIAATCGAIVVSARLARRLGGGTFAQALAAICVATSPIALILGSFYSMNAFELLLVPLAAWVLVETALRDDARGWLVFGVLAGVGLENKHTFVITVGMLAAAGLVSLRRHLRTPWPWLGAFVALLLVLPNLLWQRAHGWPSLEFYRNAQALKNVPTPPLTGFVNQLLVSGPGAAPVWIAGAVWLLRERAVRFVGVAFVVLLVAMVLSGSSRPDRIAAIYPVMFAAGGVAIERLTVTRMRLRWVVTTVPIVCGIVLVPLGVPIVPPARAAAYADALGVFPKVERGKIQPLPQPLADRLGWPELARDVAQVLRSLPAEEQSGRILVWCPRYGQAGAIELFGPALGLPPPISPHNSWWMWGPGDGDPDVLIVIGGKDLDLSALYEEHEVALVHACPLCTTWRDAMPIRVARHPRRPLRETWASLKHFE